MEPFSSHREAVQEQAMLEPRVQQRSHLLGLGLLLPQLGHLDAALDVSADSVFRYPTHLDIYPDRLKDRNSQKNLKHRSFYLYILLPKPLVFLSLSIKVNLSEDVYFYSSPISPFFVVVFIVKQRVFAQPLAAPLQTSCFFNHLWSVLGSVDSTS